MIRIGVVGALQAEIHALAGMAPRGGSVVRLPDGLLIAVSGTGSARAYQTGKRLIDAGATALASWGSAAALDSRLAPGSLLLPDEVIARTGRVFAVNADWRQRLLEHLTADATIYAGAIAESAQVLASAAEKSALATRSGAAAADMESAALAELAHDAGISFIVVRAIADGANTAVPTRLTNAIRSDGTVRPSSLGWLALSPWHWPTALRLAWQFRAALLTLARIAPVFRVCAPPPPQLRPAARRSCAEGAA
jgi:adenosylhomocysteine nucleosidase